MLFKEIIAVYCKNHMKPIRKNAEYLTVKQAVQAYIGTTWIELCHGSGG
jgi:hypothetical protein